MTTNIHQIENTRIAEVTSDHVLISSAEEGLQLLVDLYYQDFDKIVLYEQQISPEFFNLKSGMAGELLQKFSNFRVKLAIVGDFEKYSGKSMGDFIYESNQGRMVNFLPSLKTALAKLCN
ncbi:hypothetical protein PBAL39_22720 [Pedobacter sp. BAL39]|uniref:DUF4180 domain-containing protein n=1 Tax=Pedobacter sp. BAL39 TaxID=391596 RepID=UPI0001559992|nr:DUF4180 domain-containing protein [Pedobacter sp. BAL39]EDM38935.1 hypothetical protein PBAL39_22720 [Pedobacter sp. BAL39]